MQEKRDIPCLRDKTQEMQNFRIQKRSLPVDLVDHLIGRERERERKREVERKNAGELSGGEMMCCVVGLKCQKTLEEKRSTCSTSVYSQATVPCTICD